jgi:hypothetical protein
MRPEPARRGPPADLTDRVGVKHYRAAEARGVFAIALAAAGEYREAAALFADSLPIILSRSRRSSDENVTRATRALRRKEILEGYIGLLADINDTALEAELGIDAAAEAFRMADSARGQSVQRALTANAARAAASDPGLAALARREQDALTRIGALNGLLVDLMVAPAEQRDAGAILDLRTRIDDLRGLRSTLVDEIEAQFPDYAQLVKAMSLVDYRVLAFATHGLVPGDLDGLTEPALALSAPAVTGGGGDGLLTLSEILALKLDADWVVLSACNTRLGDGAGTEAVSGLGRAFFYAGTRALLVSNWPVHSRVAKELTTEVFRRQAADPGIGRAEALRQAMMALVDGPGYIDPDTGRTLFSYAHPLFWAPYSLVGDGGPEGETP